MSFVPITFRAIGVTSRVLMRGFSISQKIFRTARMRLPAVLRSARVFRKLRIGRYNALKRRGIRRRSNWYYSFSQVSGVKKARYRGSDATGKVRTIGRVSLVKNEYEESQAEKDHREQQRLRNLRRKKLLESKIAGYARSKEADYAISATKKEIPNNWNKMMKFYLED